MTPFRVVGTRTIAHAGFLAVEQRTVEAPGGERIERIVVEHPGAVVVVPMLDREHALLVRQWRAAADRELLEIPAGKRDVDGEAPEQTAARELEEEIGHRPGRLRLLAEFYNSPGFCDEYTYLFVADQLVALDEPRATRHEEAAMTVERIALGDVEALVARREIVDAKTLVGLLLARDHLAGGYPGID